MKLNNKLTRIGSLAALALGGLAIMVVASVSPVFAKEISDDSPKPESTETSVPGSSIEDDELEFKGTVEAVNGSLWTIGGVTFSVSETTFFRGSPSVGSFVEVTGDLQADGSWLARAIKIEDSFEGTDDNSSGESDDSGMDSPSDLDDSDEDNHLSGSDDSGSDDDGSNHQRGKGSKDSGGNDKGGSSDD